MMTSYCDEPTYCCKDLNFTIPRTFSKGFLSLLTAILSSECDASQENYEAWFQELSIEESEIIKSLSTSIGYENAGICEKINNACAVCPIQQYCTSDYKLPL
jgi:hypothetical protein